MLVFCQTKCFSAQVFNRYCVIRFICNICLAYTSSDELSAVATAIASDLRNGQLEPSEVTPELIDQCLRTTPMGTELPPVDVMIRTSGEVRLSDFLLWQSGFSMFAFVETLWPDFSLWDFAKIIMQYKWHYSTLGRIKSSYFRSSRSLTPNQEACVRDYSEMRAVIEK